MTKGTSLSEHIDDLIDEEPEGYKVDYLKAKMIRKLVNQGLNPLEVIKPPERWREIFIGVSLGTDLSAYMAAQVAGVSLSYLRYYLKNVTDKPVVEALNLGRIGNFERRIDSPTAADLRSPTIPVTGLNALSDWQTETAEKLTFSESQKKKIRELREKYNLALEASDLEDAQEAEQFRATALEGNDENGVLGLEFTPEDIGDDE
jgi:hypothetical protein